MWWMCRLCVDEKEEGREEGSAMDCSGMNPTDCSRCPVDGYGNDEHATEDTSDDAEANPIAAETLAWYDVNMQGVAHHPCLER